MENNPANYTDPSGHSPFAMLEGGSRRRKTTTNNQIKPRINLEDGTIYAPSTQEHKAHEIRQHQTQIYQHTYIPSTSYQYTQQQVTKPQETQLSRLDWARITGHSTYDWGQSRLREAANIGRNWTKALEETLKHFCDPNTLKGEDDGKSEINNQKLKNLASAIFVSSIVSTSLLGSITGIEKKNISKQQLLQILGRSEVTFDKETPKFISSGGGATLYSRASVLTSTPASGIFQGHFNNGLFTGGTIDLGLITGSLDFKENEATANLSLKLFEHTVGVNTGLGIDGASISAGHNDGKHSNEYGLNVNLDVVNGLVGLYHKHGVINVDKSGVHTTTYLENGVRLVNGPVAGVVGLTLAGAMFYISGGSSSQVSAYLAATSLAAIFGTESIEREINDKQYKD